MLTVPFIFLSAPTPGTLLAGACPSILGLGLRAFAAGSIHKDRELAVGGPYRMVRHPLYLGTLLVGLGFALASGRWWMVLVFLALFSWVYGRTVRAEESRLEVLFGKSFETYRKKVPAFVPRIGRRMEATEGPGFRSWLYWRNKEWQAAFGTLIGFGLLWARMWLVGWE